MTGSLPVDHAPGVALSLSGLRTGPPPRIPWTEGRTFHFRGHDVTLAPYLTYNPTPDASAPYGNGAVVEVWDRNPLIIWYDDAGRRLRESLFSDGLAWSAAFHEVAWTTPRGAVLVASSTTGRILHRFLPNRPFPSPAAAGWFGAGDLLFPVGWLSPRGWRTSTDAVTPEPASPTAVSAKNGLVAGILSPTRGSDVACLATWKVGEPPAVLWNGCLMRGARTYTAAAGVFNPNGRLFADSGHYVGRGTSQPFVAVMDAHTGEVVARFDQGNDDGDFRQAQYLVSAMRWEDDTHLLFVVADRTLASLGPSREIQPLEALVRCDVHTVACELATPPKRTSLMDTAAYGLVGANQP